MQSAMPKNKAGSCFECGQSFGFYDTKLIEIAEPSRLRCSGAWGEIDQSDHIHKELISHEQWYYYTDG